MRSVFSVTRHRESLVMVGFRHGEEKIDLAKPYNFLQIKIRKQFVGHVNEKPVCFYPPLSIRNPATGLPDLAARVPSRTDIGTKVASIIHRFGREMPAHDGDVMKDFITYARAVIVKHFKPISALDVPDFETWLSKTSYGEGRKKQLRAVREKMIRADEKFFVNKSFLKDEIYGEAKHARSINSYSDESKVLLGPAMHAIDKAVFTLPYFVKGTNPRTWPEKLAKLFGEDPVMATDFSSFEAHHRGPLAELGRFWIMHMLRGAGTRQFKAIVSRMFLGNNVCQFEDVTAVLKETLMSGALWTSSANGVLNLLLMSYLVGRGRFAEVSPVDLATLMPSYYRGVHEGDDGLCATAPVDLSLINRLGLKLKFNYFPHFSMAGFCNIYSLPDGSDCITDPIKVLRNFFCLPSKYLHMRESHQKGLLRAKAQSLLYLYPAAPIVSSLARAVCTATKSVDSRHSAAELGYWQREVYELAVAEQAAIRRGEIVEKKVSAGARALTSEIFNVPIEDQYRIEAALDRLDFDIDLSAYAHASEHAYIETHLLGMPTMAPEHVHPLVAETLASLTFKGKHSDCLGKMGARIERRFRVSGDMIVPTELG